MEGIYFFGGRNQQEVITNKLFLLKIGKSKPVWVRPETTGITPFPRYGHTMEYYQSMKILVIFGGRNEFNSFKDKSYCSNEIAILKISDNLTWLNLSVYGQLPEPRYSHCSAFLSSQLLIFGGISEINYCNASVWALEFDLKEISKEIEEENSKKASIMKKSRSVLK